MLTPRRPTAPPLLRLPDGTVKQVNPFSGTEVWTVPGRGHRPLSVPGDDPHPIDPDGAGRYCAFCEHRYLETPPEKGRLVRRDGAFVPVTGLTAERLGDDPAEFRRIPNLFEIVGLDYWRQNHGYVVPPAAQAARTAYLATPGGQDHVRAVLRTKLRAAGVDDAAWEAMSEEERFAHADDFFAGGHDVIVGRRHYVDGALTQAQLASSGTLTPDEHAAYLGFSVDAMRELYAANPHVKYVAAFQNWLKPAGASFDHLHKQLVAIDSRSVLTELEMSRLRDRPNMYNELAVDYAASEGLLLADNDDAVAFAGFGRRYPTVEVYSRSAATRPWDLGEAELRAMSDLVHAVHAATGAAVPCNEEWSHQPPDVELPMPWRIVVKLRVSTLAGFEGGTKIYVNTIDPWTLRDRLLPELRLLREAGRLADGIRLGDECDARPDSLRYHRP